MAGCSRNVPDPTGRQASNQHMRSERKYAPVFQFFYHCEEEELPVRDYLNTQGHNRKTEPHYENLTENWCRRCMANRIRSANKRKLDYLFLVTTYRKTDHPLDGKHLVVGFLHRAKPDRVKDLNRGRRKDANRFDDKQPEDCGFFAGDQHSHFVSAENASKLPDSVKNPRYKYLADKQETNTLLTHLRRSTNILPELKRKVLSQKPGVTMQTCKPSSHNQHASSKKQYGTC